MVCCYFQRGVKGESGADHDAPRRPPSGRGHSVMRLRPLSMAVYAFVFTIAVASAARVVSRDPPRITLADQGTLLGREVVVTRTQRARLYLGIPFAAPPIDDLRFAPPKTNPLPSWEGVKNATTYLPACMQIKEKFAEHDKLKLQSKLFPEEEIEFSEDCLYLNVYVPDGECINLM